MPTLTVTALDATHRLSAGPEAARVSDYVHGLGHRRDRRRREPADRPARRGSPRRVAGLGAQARPRYQHKQSDYDFLRAIAAEYGFDMWVDGDFLNFRLLLPRAAAARARAALGRVADRLLAARDEHRPGDRRSESGSGSRRSRPSSRSRWAGTATGSATGSSPAVFARAVRHSGGDPDDPRRSDRQPGRRDQSCARRDAPTAQLPDHRPRHRDRRPALPGRSVISVAGRGPPLRGDDLSAHERGAHDRPGGYRTSFEARKEVI